MIEIQNKIDCCGCNACGDICPKDAISFHTDNEGFWYPEVDKDKCIDCHLCERTCPIIHADNLKKNNLTESICYAAEHKNINTVFGSTSGGLFSALAEITYRENGFVGGAIFNKDLSVRQILTDNYEDLYLLRGSKYTQSHFDGFYKKVHHALTDGHDVLVCGCPCQMAALRAFLNRDYEHLIIVDFICRAIGSPKVFRKYMDSFEERYGSPVISARAKSKEYGWRNLTQEAVLANGKHIYETAHESVWTSHFNRDGLFHRPSCHNCKFKGFPRIADITIADYWGCENSGITKLKDKDLGLSLVMINTNKGKQYFEQVKKKINYEETPLSSVLPGNMALINSVQQEKADRTQFYTDLESMSLREAIDRQYNCPQNDEIRKPSNISIVKRIRNKLLFEYSLFRTIMHYTGLNFQAWKNFVLYNTKEEIKKGHVLYPMPYSVIEQNGRIELRGKIVLGVKRIAKSKSETRLIIDKGGTLIIGKGGWDVGYGSDIQVFKDSVLSIEGPSNINSNAIIICGKEITIGKDVRIGRNVTIRDNNGEHYMNIPGYKVSSPIVIGDHVWLGEGCTIMPGVKIGDGAVVSAMSVVTSNVPPRAIVAGNPAVIVERDILWKF